MDREEAIEWCRNKFQGHWPNTTKNSFPNGWCWIVRNKPYQLPEYKLINAKFSEIAKSDVYK